MASCARERRARISALTHPEQALAIYREELVPAYEAKGALASVAYARREMTRLQAALEGPEAALDSAQSSIDAQRRSGNPRGEASTWGLISDLQLARLDFDSALQVMQEEGAACVRADWRCPFSRNHLGEDCGCVLPAWGL